MVFVLGQNLAAIGLVVVGASVLGMFVKSRVPSHLRAEQHLAAGGEQQPPASWDSGTLDSANFHGEKFAARTRRAEGIWITREEVLALPTAGDAWNTLYEEANRPPLAPRLADNADDADVRTLAKALVGVRLGNKRYVSEVRSTIMTAMGTERGGKTLALGRNLAAFIVAAELVGLEPDQEERFRAYLRQMLTKQFHGRSIRSTHEDRPNNWGTMAGGTRLAIAIYLDDHEELARAARVFNGWLGHRSSYSGFKYKELHWQSNPREPVGINPLGAMKNGHNLDGALPEEMRRGGPLVWPPIKTGYAWEGLQGAMVQAEILHRAGYDAWEWEDQALLRAVKFLNGIGWYAEGDDEWLLWLVDARYGTRLAKNPKARPGKNLGWTAWTHGDFNSTP